MFQKANTCYSTKDIFLETFFSEIIKKKIIFKCLEARGDERISDDNKKNIKLKERELWKNSKSL